MYKAKMFRRGFQMPKMSLGQLQNYPKTNSNLRMHSTNLKSNKKFKKKSDEILMDIIKEAKDMRSSYLQSRDVGMKRPLDTRIVRSSYLPPQNKYLKSDQYDSYPGSHSNEKYSYPVEYPPMNRDSSDANSNLEMASLRVSLRKLQHYLSDKEFTYNSAIMCLDRALHATHCSFFLDYSVRKGYIEKEGILKLGSLTIGFGKSVSEEETQKLAYIDALRSLKFKRIEEILNLSDCSNETNYYQEPNKPPILLTKTKSISELVIIESDLFASDRFKFSVSILHNSVVANKMKIRWEHIIELGTHKMNVYVQEKLVGTGRGATKPEAKKNAACDALFKYFYKNNVILQVTSEVETDICIPYSNVTYLVSEYKRRRNSYSGDEYADDGPFATVIENLIDSYSWSVLNNELLFGPGFFGEQVVLLKKIGEKKNLLMRKKRYKDGHYFSLHTGEDYSDIVKYLLKNGGRGGKYRILPKSDIPELKSAKWQYYQKGVKSSNQTTGNMNEMPGHYRNYSDGNFVRRGDQLSHGENVHKNISDSCTNMSQDPYDYKGYNYGKHPDNKRDYDRHFSSPNFAKTSVNLESKQIPNMGAKHMNSNSSYYDRSYGPDDYEREINVSNRINSDVNQNERGMYSHNQRSSMNDDGRYNSMDDQHNSFHHSKTGYSQRSYDMDCNTARDRMNSTDTNTYDSRYFRKGFDPATGEKMDDFTYSRNNRGFDLIESNDNYHSRTVYEYDNVQDRAGFNPSSMYNSRDITAAPKEHTGFNQEYRARNPGSNYDREFSSLPDQYDKPYMYASRNEKNFQMERREEMFDRDFHPMSRREFNETPSFQNKPIRQNPRDMSFNQIESKNVNRMDLAPGFGNTYGNVKRNNGNNAYERELNLRETVRNIGNIRPIGKDVLKPWLPTNNKPPGNISMSAMQTLNMQRLGLNKLSNRLSSTLMNMNQSPTHNQIMLLKLLTKKIAQNALQNNVKNILANAKRLSNIARARQMMEQAKPFNIPKKAKKAKAVEPPVKEAPKQMAPKQAALKQAASKQTSNIPKATKVKQASVPAKKVKK